MGKKISKVRQQKIVTEKLNALISERGGYSKAALESLGVSWPPKKGWKKALIDAAISGDKKRASPHRKKSSKPKIQSFYASWEWKQARYEIFRIHGRRCMCCGWQPGDTDHGRLVVDHIKPRSKYPKLQLDLSNMQVLCNDCNMGKSNIYEDDWRDDPSEGDPLTAQFRGIMQ